MKMTMRWAGVILATSCLLACQREELPQQEESEPVSVVKEGFNPFDANAKPSGYYSYASISVPAGTSEVYVTYESLSGKKTEKVSVTPEVVPPSDGKDVEPFGKVKLLLSAPQRTKVSVSYRTAGDQQVYALTDFPVDQVTFGAFGVTRYVQVQWSFAFQCDENTNWQSAPTYPKDVVFYDKEHDHTLRYCFAYSGSGNGYGYFLEEAYVIEDYVVKGEKYNYCASCHSCPYCMPWGCSCGCGSEHAAFQPSGDLTSGVDEAVTVDSHGSIIVSYAPYNTVQVQLPEPASYQTADEGLAFYHSSGTVMFEDSWPTVHQGGVYDTDFDDVVVDYDFEARLIPDSMPAEQRRYYIKEKGLKEQVKVVLHLRAVGSGNPYRVGVKMEGFDQQYVEKVEQHFSLDSYNNPHGELPAVTVETLQKNSGVYLDDPLNPVVEMAHLHVMNQERAGKGAAAEYTYKNGSFVNKTVFNLTYGYKERDDSQYSQELTTMQLPVPFNNILKQKYYNCIPGYINVSGGLFTYTVIFKMKDRSQMDAISSEKAKELMVQAVMNTLSQNFYIIADGSFTPVGLKGYSPVLVHSQSKSSFNRKLQQGLESGSILDQNNPYAGSNGMVWGFKCPTLTKHVWNKLYFSSAYPLYEGWVTSMGAQNANWYRTDVDTRFLVCDW